MVRTIGFGLQRRFFCVIFPRIGPPALAALGNSFLLRPLPLSDLRAVNFLLLGMTDNVFGLHLLASHATKAEPFAWISKRSS
jgi:hypothetical protein